MGAKTEIDDELAGWIAAQPMFFVASAPLSAAGHVNLSPRGLDCFRLLGPDRVAFLDLTGSGNETAAHMLENGRITLMFCAFTGKPKILRLFGRGQAIQPGASGWQALRAHFPADLPGVRQIFLVEVSAVRTSCGFGVPLMAFERQREDLLNWAENKGEAGLEEYRQRKNAYSLDGLPAPGQGNT